jgi:hypothetical protein
VVQTNPIDWSQLCETNPICSRRWEGATALRERSYGELDIRSASAKQSQFLDCGLGTSLRRDAHSAACHLGPARADCAKQTQFRRGRAGRDLGDGGRVRGTKPICSGRRAERGRRGMGRGAIVQNEPNFGRSLKSEAGGANARNEPNLVRPQAGRSFRRAKCAERSQFAPRTAQGGAEPNGQVAIVRNEPNLRQGRRGDDLASPVLGAALQPASSQCWEMLALRGTVGYDDTSQWARLSPVVSRGKMPD